MKTISKIKEINKAFDEKFTGFYDYSDWKKVISKDIKAFYTQQILSLIEELIPKERNKVLKNKDKDVWRQGFNECVDQMRASIKSFLK